MTPNEILAESLLVALLRKIDGATTLGDGDPTVSGMAKEHFQDFLERAGRANERLEFSFQAGVEFGMNIGFAAGTSPPTAAEDAVRNAIQEIAESWTEMIADRIENVA